MDLKVPVRAEGKTTAWSLLTARRARRNASAEADCRCVAPALRLLPHRRTSQFIISAHCGAAQGPRWPSQRPRGFRWPRNRHRLLGHVNAKEKPRKSDDDDAGGPPKRGLSDLIETMKASGGVIDLSQSMLARQLGTSRTRLQRPIHELSEAGALVLETGKSGTRLALA